MKKKQDFGTGSGWLASACLKDINCKLLSVQYVVDPQSESKANSKPGVHLERNGGQLAAGLLVIPLLPSWPSWHLCPCYTNSTYAVACACIADFPIASLAPIALCCFARVTLLAALCHPSRLSHST
jgi:hypothetical protein